MKNFNTEELATLLDLVVAKRKEQIDKYQKVKNWIEKEPLKVLEDKLRKLLLGDNS